MARQFKPGQLQTGSLYNISSSFAISASYAIQALSSSYAISSSYATSASYAVSSSYAAAATSASYALTASYVNPLHQNVIITGSLFVTQSHISTIDYIDFTIPANPAYQEGRIHWTDDTKTLQVDTDVNGFMIEVGHQNVVRVRNTTGNVLTKGKIVYINGESGNRPTVVTASWDGDPTSAATLGWVAQNISDSQTGYVITNGILRDINTNAYSPGTQLYLSSSGDYTSTIPISPKHEVRLGKVITQATAGTIYVDVMNGYEIGELHDVLINDKQHGDLIAWNSGSRVWENTKTLSGSYGVSGSLNAPSITGSLFGTASYATTAATSSYFVETDPIFVSKSGSFATTGSNTFNGNQIINGNITVNGTASVALLYTTYETSSVIFTSGSTKFGNTTDDTHQFTGSLFVNDGTYTIIDTNAKTLNDNVGITSVDWYNRWLTYDNGLGNATTVDWASLKLKVPNNDESGGSFDTVNWQENRLYRSYDVAIKGNGVSLDWHENRAYDVVGAGGGPAVSIDWENRRLYNYQNQLTVDWLNAFLSYNTFISLNWANRNLIATNGTTTVLNWNNTTTAWFSGSVIGTASWASNAVTSSYSVFALSSSYATTASYVQLSQTASYVQTAQTASYVLQSVSSSFSTTASYSLISVSSSFASTASYVTASSVYGPYGADSVTSSSYALTASYALNSGASTDTGSLLVTASAALNVITFVKGDGSTFPITVDTGSSSGGSSTDTGSLLVTASISQNIFTFTKGNSSTFDLVFETGSFVLNSQTSSMSVATASYILAANIDGTVVSSSYAITSSYALNGGDAPFPYTGSAQITGSLVINNFLSTAVQITANAGATTIYALPTASYDGAWFEYSARSGSNARAGQITSIWSGSQVNFTETTTTDFGTTSDLSLGVFVVGGAMALTSSAATSGWTIKTIIRSF